MYFEQQDNRPKRHKTVLIWPIRDCLQRLISASSLRFKQMGPFLNEFNINPTNRQICCSVVKVVLWSRGGAHLTKPGWNKPNTHSNPTNLALFRHKITLYRFNQGGSYYCRGAQMGAGGLSHPSPLTLTTAGVPLASVLIWLPLTKNIHFDLLALNLTSSVTASSSHTANIILPHTKKKRVPYQ